MKFPRTLLTTLACLGFFTGALSAQVPQLLNYQGRVAVGTVNFDGSGQFKFALVNGNASTTYWSNDGSSNAGSQPTAAVSLTVTKGLYAVLLGDTSVANMTAIPASVWSNADVRLRVWFNDGTNGFQLLTPDQRLAPNGYLPDGAVTSGKIASGAVGSGQLAAGAVTGSALAPGAMPAPLTVSGHTQALANTGYVATGTATPDTFTLPATANVGDVIQITGNGSAGWNTTGAWGAYESNRGWACVASSADGSKRVAAEFGGRIYTSTDFGVSWTPRDGSRNWISVASSSDGTKLVAVVSGGQIYTSTDSGVSWTARDSNRNWNSVASSSDGSKLVAAVSGGQLYTSADSGATWTARESSRNWWSVTSSADGSKLLALVAGGYLYTSTDSGTSWTPRLTDTNRSWQAAASSSDGSALVALVAGGQIYTSTNSGVNWTPRMTDGNRSWNTVASSSDGSKLVAAVYGGQIFTSTDFGVNWTAREGSRLWSSVASSSDGSKLSAAVYLGQIYTNLSGAQGSSVTLQYLGNGQWGPRQETQIAAGAVGRAQLAAGAVTNAAIESGTVPAPQAVSGGTQAVTNTSYAATGTAAPDTFNLPATANVGDIIQITGSGSAGWSTRDAWVPRESNRSWSSVASSSDGSKLVAVVSGGQIYTSTDSGLNWTARESNRAWWAVASSADGTKLVAAEYGGQIYTSADFGVTWTARESNRGWLSVASSSDGSKLVAVDYSYGGNGGQIYTSTDSGVTWTARESNRRWRSVASSSDGSKLVAVVGEFSVGGQIYTSTDSGVTWTARESNRYWYSVASSSDGSKLVAAEYGGQIYTNLSGGQAGAVTLQYTGSGQWIAQQETQIAAGAVGNAQIATGAVNDSKLASAISATKLGSGTVDNSEFNFLDGVTSNIQAQIDTTNTSLNGKVSKAGDTMTGSLTIQSTGSNRAVALANGSTVIGEFALPMAAGQYSTDAAVGDVVLRTPAGGKLLLQSGNAASTLCIGTSNRVGIGTTSPGARLHIKAHAASSRDNGIRLEHFGNTSFWNIHADESVNNLTFSFNGSFPSGNFSYLNPNQSGLITVSDRSTKKDIVPMAGALDQMARLRPVSFRYKSAPDGSPVNYGFIAQEVEEVFPDIVLQNEGLKTLATNSLIAINTRAIQELNAKHKADVKALREENAALKARLEKANADKDAALTAMAKRLADLESDMEARLTRLEKAGPAVVAPPVKVALEK